MAIRIKPKSFGPFHVRFSEKEALLYAHNGEDFSATPTHGTPVDLLLFSVGACIAKSLQIAAEKSQSKLSPFTVEVIGEKATDLPNRLGSIGIRVLGPLTNDEDQSANLLREAKSICTVSNTLNCKITVASDRS